MYVHHISTLLVLCEGADPCMVLAQCQAGPRERSWNSLGQKKSLCRAKNIGAVSLPGRAGKSRARGGFSEVVGLNATECRCMVTKPLVIRDELLSLPRFQFP